MAVYSEWHNAAQRVRLRDKFWSCGETLPIGHAVELVFFMGASDDAEAVMEEGQRWGDMVLVGGPDKDFHVPGDDDPQLHIVEPGSARARAYRAAFALQWMLTHRPLQDYVIFFEDHSFPDLPRLLPLVEVHANTSLVLGSLHEQPLLPGGDYDKSTDCELCTPPEHIHKVCMARMRELDTAVDYRACLTVARRCCPPESSPASCTDLDECVMRAKYAGMPAAAYYGTVLGLPSPVGSRWVIGKDIVQYLGENAEELKVRGDLDVVMGFWLAALEDVHFVDFPLENVFEAL